MTSSIESAISALTRALLIRMLRPVCVIVWLPCFNESDTSTRLASPAGAPPNNRPVATATSAVKRKTGPSRWTAVQQAWNPE